MKASNIVLLGIKKSVLAIDRRTGDTIWSTKLSGGMGAEFVTVLCEGQTVFACCRGVLHALNLFSGEVLWSNDLKGYGYGVATLALPGGSSAPSAAALQQLIAEEAALAAAGASASSPG